MVHCALNRLLPVVLLLLGPVITITNSEISVFNSAYLVRFMLVPHDLQVLHTFNAICAILKAYFVITLISL